MVSYEGNLKAKTTPIDEPVGGFKVDIEIKECMYGLGVFFKTDIKKGTLIWKCLDIGYP